MRDSDPGFCSSPDNSTQPQPAHLGAPADQPLQPARGDPRRPHLPAPSHAAGARRRRRTARRPVRTARPHRRCRRARAPVPRLHGRALLPRPPGRRRLRRSLRRSAPRPTGCACCAAGASMPTAAKARCSRAGWNRASASCRASTASRCATSFRPAYLRYLEMRSAGLYGTNALEAQLDLLYAYCQYEFARRARTTTADFVPGHQPHRRARSAGGRRQAGRSCCFNNLISFTSFARARRRIRRLHPRGRSADDQDLLPLRPAARPAQGRGRASGHRRRLRSGAAHVMIRPSTH